MLSEYGIRIYSHDFKKMKWGEFAALLSGLSADSPLGRVVAVRCETDPKIIEKFTPAQRRIHREWRNRRAQSVGEKQLGEALDFFKNMFKGMAGE